MNAVYYSCESAPIHTSAHTQHHSHTYRLLTHTTVSSRTCTNSHTASHRNINKLCLNTLTLVLIVTVYIRHPPSHRYHTCTDKNAKSRPGTKYKALLNKSVSKPICRPTSHCVTSTPIHQNGSFTNMAKHTGAV